jgi:hypothetical protein
MPKFKKPSEEFESAFIQVGSIMVDCELCGITHVGNDEFAIKDNLGTKDYNQLRRDMKKNPKKYIYHPETDMIPWGRIDGKQAVIGCPCNKLSLYENLFWNSRYIISEYFFNRAEKELDDANKNKNLATKIKEAVK